ncbi:Fur-regulated basic protein FbpA [Tuberibacillus sp. Marseille-P3662]|uniref:Fur-regulated basic protein FbpA n=1 Tax=Tuberibacillus sp. Marseille-P3662 TaxID=1965358 RepID=UPI000A1CB524|nr:Fur-regulated basic protein FbpA [Tuberibacillus sp. Marseille-P3662]
MGTQLREAIEKKKQFYIDRLLHLGVYKTNHQLYELTLSELEQLYRSEQSKQQVINHTRVL